MRAWDSIASTLCPAQAMAAAKAKALLACVPTSNTSAMDVLVVDSSHTLLGWASDISIMASGLDYKALATYLVEGDTWRHLR